jgi:hypothetical protein
MKYLALVAAATLSISACATIENESSTTAVLSSGFNAGERYQIRTRTMSGPNGSFQQTSVVYKGISRVCIPDSPGDCEKAARLLIDNYDDAFF